MLTFGSLFAGIGGFDLGFERAGMRCEWQVEIDGYATRVLEKHWPDVRRWDDVRTFPPEPKGEWRVDVICGGFPCQDISYAGRGAGITGERSGLFFEAVRVVSQLRPRIVVLENVAALLSRGLDRVCGELAEIGYDTEWHCVPAAYFGAPHIRDRVWVLANTECDGCGSWRTKRQGQQRGAAFVGAGCDVSDTNSRRQQVGEKQYSKSQEIATNGNSCWEHIDGLCDDVGKAGKSSTIPYSYGKGLEIRQGQDASQWTVEPDVGRVANGIPARVDRLRGLGNAVVPQVAEWIGRRIVDFDSGTT